MFDFHLLQGWFLMFARISSFVAVAPFFSMQGVPAIIKVGFSFIFAVILFPLITFEGINNLTLVAWWLLVAKEVVVGLTLGFMGTLVFAAVRIAGEMIDIQMGFAMANVLDPHTKTRITLMGQLKYMLAFLIFLAVDGHHLLIAALAHSYNIVPITQAVIDANISLFIVKVFVGMFALAFKIAAPIVAVLVISDICLGLVARTVPQIHVFILGFPLKSGLGLFTVALTLPLFATIMSYILSQLEADLLTIMEIFSP